LARLAFFTAARRSCEYLLSAPQFEQAAISERMRVDRNGSVLSILLLRIPPTSSIHNPYTFLGRALAGRLRITDSAGLTHDGQIGVLLPDTPATGARKVAQDICHLFDRDEDRPDWEVLVYPDQPAQREWMDDRIPVGQEAPGEQPVGVSATVGRATAPVSTLSAEHLFARHLPWWKRATDITVGSLGLVIAAPVIALGAGAVMLSSRGGPFFVQQREGLGGRRFNIFKIRTMNIDAEKRKEDLRQHSEQDGPAFKMSSDPRVTRVGQILRALSLDELPQLLNVVRGDMSLVGPRPLPVEESTRCEAWQRQRLQVTPGITCTWQVRARNQVPFDEWVRMDLNYLRRQSLLHDMRLLLETGPSIVFSKGPR